MSSKRVQPSESVEPETKVTLEQKIDDLTKSLKSLKPKREVKRRVLTEEQREALRQRLVGARQARVDKKKGKE